MVQNLGITFDPVMPMPLLAALAAGFGALTVLNYWRVGRALNRGKNLVLLAFRLAGLGLVFALLAQPSRQYAMAPPKMDKVTLIAVDTSRSMKQADVEKMTRIEAAKNALYEADLGVHGADRGKFRLFEFNSDATPLTGPIESLKAEGSSTSFNRSISSMLNSMGPGEEARALVLLTDGHDFEMVNPARTGAMARSRHVPIYAAPFGRRGKVRDAAIHIGNYQPYCYVKQKTRISGVLRLIGCEYEELTIQLLRNNEVVQTRRVNSDEFSQMTVEFEVAEPAVGQYEYEMRVAPLENEIDVKNNSAITYLNVIDQQAQVLLIEGSPYWDTTFLQRSLMRNEKINLDCVLQYATNRVRVIRKKGSDLKIPASADAFNQYDVVILGRSVDRILDVDQITALQEYVRERGGTVIFSRGRAFEVQTNDLEPVIWDATPQEKVRLQVSREGQAAAPFKMLGSQKNESEAMPDLIAGRKVLERKPLAAVLAEAKGRDSGETMPGFVHRRFGQGQVLSVGVEGLWRWAFNSRIETQDALFDRFWDQTVLWLIAGRDVLPNKQYSFRCGSANVLLGEKAFFKLVMRSANRNIDNLPVVIFQDDKEVGRAALTQGENTGGCRLSGEFLPERTGKYRAVATLPDGTREESKFIVFDENLEETEVATDVTYLQRLCESSGGRVITPQELKKLSAELDGSQIEAAPQVRTVSIWDRPWCFYLIGLLLGADWYLRRRWGLT
jgi:hypothetical protein